jgi:hypothetical protein
MLRSLFLSVVFAVIAAVVINSLPDMGRYLKIREM